MRVTFFILTTALLCGCGPKSPETLPPLSCDVPSPGPSPLRRLTRTEYDNTIRDLLNEDIQIGAETFPGDVEGIGFGVAENVSSTMAELYQDAAETLAERAISRGAIDLPCNPSEVGNDACAEIFVRQFGERAYRSPLSDDQVNALMGVYRASTDQGDDYTVALSQIIAAALQSPYFVYRVEVAGPNPDNDDAVRLSSYEIASRLSYLLWNTMPDEELFEAAQADALQDSASVEAQARRMLDHPNARQAVVNFFLEWFEVPSLLDAIKDPEQYPEFTDELRADLMQETRAFLEDLIWERDANVETLFNASHTFVNARLAQFYGIEGVVGDGFVQVPLPSNRAPGLLGHGSVLASHGTPDETSPVLRGLFVRTRMLCQPVSPPPENIIIVPPDPAPGLTTRERYAEHTSNSSCYACHQFMDPLGFGFEEYDTVGRFRTEEHGLPIDASGEITRTQDIDGTFYGLAELSSALSESEQVRECISNQWFRYAFARFEDESDTCSISTLYDALESSGGDLREILIALTRTDAFLYRRAITPES